MLVTLLSNFIWFRSNLRMVHSITYIFKQCMIALDLENILIKEIKKSSKEQSF